MKRRKVAWFLTLLCTVTLLTGCWDDRPVEERGMVLMLGISPNAHHGVTLYFEVPTASGLTSLTSGGSSGSGSGPKFIVYRGQGDNFSDAFTNAQGKTNEDIYLGQLQVIALSTRLSPRAFTVIDATLARLGPMDKSADAVAVSGSMAKFMAFSPVGTSLPGLYLASLFACRHCQTAHLARTVWSREKRLWSPTTSVWVPLITTNATTFIVDRIVVYHGYQPTIILTPHQTRTLGFLLGITAKAPLTVPMSVGIISLRAVRAHPHFRTMPESGGKVLIHLTVSLSATLDGVPPNVTITTPLLHELEAKADTLLSHRMLKILLMLQKKDSNPLGFGRSYVWFHQDFTTWPTLYRQATIAVTARIHVHQLGDLQ